MGKTPTITTTSDNDKIKINIMMICGDGDYGNYKDDRKSKQKDKLSDKLPDHAKGYTFVCLKLTDTVMFACKRGFPNIDDQR